MTQPSDATGPFTMVGGAGMACEDDTCALPATAESSPSGSEGA